MGVPGVAFLYVRRALVDSLRPTVTGWFGRVNPFAFSVNELDWSDTASRFDTGTPPVINAYIARAGMEIINGIGVEHIRAWHEVLAARLILGGTERGLSVFGPTDVAQKTASTAFLVSDSHAVENEMRKRGVIASARGAVIRLAPHYYSTLSDVEATRRKLLKQYAQAEFKRLNVDGYRGELSAFATPVVRHGDSVTSI